MKKKSSKTAQDLYKSNQKKSKAMRIASPIVFWVCLALALVCFIVALYSAFGSISEITCLLDSQKYTGEQLSENYQTLISKYGEWVIGTGANGFQIKFINIKKAVFSWTLVVNFSLAVFFFAAAYLLGKWVLPKLSAQVLIDNQDMVNLTILKESEKRAE